MHRESKRVSYLFSSLEGRPRTVEDMRSCEATFKTARVYDLARTIALTQILTRKSFCRRLDAAIGRHGGSRCSTFVGFVDIDRFARINTTFGRATAEKLIRHAMQRLIRRAGECGVAARIGADEFALFVPDMSGPEEAIDLAERIMTAFSQPFVQCGSKFYITLSMGVCSYPKDGADAWTLLERAESAMLRAKRAGRNNYQLYAAPHPAVAV